MVGSRAAILDQLKEFAQKILEVRGEEVAKEVLKGKVIKEALGGQVGKQAATGEVAKEALGDQVGKQAVTGGVAKEAHNGKEMIFYQH